MTRGLDAGRQVGFLTRMKWFFRGGLGLVVMVLGACAQYDTRLNSRSVSYLGQGETMLGQTTRGDIAQSKSYWDAEGHSGKPSIVIDLKEQTASFYMDNKLVGVSAISSGREGYETPSGHYRILEKKPDHRSNLYGDYQDEAGNVVVSNVGVKTDPMPPGTRFVGAPMPYWMRLTSGGVGMHQGFLPGVPDSHGCIRLPEQMAKTFFAHVQKGTPVRVINGSTPSS